MFNIFFAIHIFFGSLAVLTFWAPLVLKKGNSGHINWGKFYIVVMSIAVITALILCGLRLINPGSSLQQQHFAWFLIFISVLTSSSAWYGIRVWRFKNRTTVHQEYKDIGISFALLLSGVLMAGYGYYYKQILLTYFPFIGILLGISQLRYWLTIPKATMHAWFEHMSGMFACVISTLTAFSVVGFPRLIHVQIDHWALWLGPTLILVPILIIWITYYKRKFIQLTSKMQKDL